MNRAESCDFGRWTLDVGLWTLDLGLVAIGNRQLEIRIWKPYQRNSLGIRNLLKQPTFAVTALLTLAIGIGANTTSLVL